ncbi:hypothetical protein AV274_5813 [Blastocystis sp. ATCC 50177/Nand II]|uniref:Uncharacterized protein n=1 Tax=Blastocystis sp. subtype 1 (strain ATCC 50177 / NandII) TaxID=478820 RepID=A0A196S5W3_BLAHN|nr:hypothetical protein AV274_5813 [Blastocystis sp. ATCC 50177/Nand II]
MNSFLVGSLSFIAGLYVDQNYNVPDIKYWVKHAEDVITIIEKKYRKKKGDGDDN